MKILVLGGTKFFGARLVEKLVADGHHVTVATRGLTEDRFGSSVRRIRVDRSDANSMLQAFSEEQFDVVYDQICFNPRDAKYAIDAFGNRVKRYILTSSQAVYDNYDKHTIIEAEFDPTQYSFDLDTDTYSYAEGKRQAEAYFFQHASFPVVAVRVGLVISGNDDYTRRFEFHVAHILEGESIGILPNANDFSITYVTAWDIAEFLQFIGLKSDFVGPINAGNRGGFYTVREICEEIATYLVKSVKFHERTDAKSDKHFSPYSIPVSFNMSVELAKTIGFDFPDIKPSIPRIVDEIANRLNQ